MRLIVRKASSFVNCDNQQSFKKYLRFTKMSKIGSEHSMESLNADFFHFSAKIID